MKKKRKLVVAGIMIAFIAQICSFVPVKTAMAAANGYWQLKSKEIQYVEPFLPEKVTVVDDLPWGKDFTKVVNGGEMSTSYTGQEFDVTRNYYSKYWPQPTQNLRFTWSEMPETIYPGESYKVWLETSGNGFGSGIISKLVNTSGPMMWLATAVYNNRANVEINTDAPSNPNDAEKRMIVIGLSSGGSGTDTFNYANYCYIYEWVNVQPKITSITVSPSKISFSNYSPIQLSVKGKLSDGSEIDITKDPNTDYDVDDAGVLNISATGLVKPSDKSQNGDSATITVTNGEAEGTCVVVNAVSTVKSINSTTSKVVLYNQTGKNSKQLKITAVMSSGKKVDVTKSAGYKVSNPKYFTVTPSGMLKVLLGAPKGTTGTVTVTFGDKTTKISITVK